VTELTPLQTLWLTETVRLRDFLMRTGTPHEYIDLEHAEDVEGLLEQFNVRPDETPIVLCNGTVLRNPTIEILGE
jgi:thioredoxin reductase (NADPH)